LAAAFAASCGQVPFRPLAKRDFWLQFLKELCDLVDIGEVRTIDRHGVEVVSTVLASSVTLVFLSWLVLRIGGGNGGRYFDDIVTALAALSACVSCRVAGKRQSGSQRRFWLLLALALWAWTFAEVIWAVYDLVLHVAVPVPSWADVGYLGAIPLAAAALLYHPACTSPGTSRRGRLSTASPSVAHCCC
jgi:hypothetical protein